MEGNTINCSQRRIARDRAQLRDHRARLRVVEAAVHPRRHHAILILIHVGGDIGRANAVRDNCWRVGDY